jgi:GTP-binding protein YchF
MHVGIIGLTNVGKSTLFRALTRIKVGINNFPFCTIDPNIGAVPVPDERLEAIAGLIKPKKKTHANVEFVDVAGLVRGASQGEGLGNQFLGKLREMDVLLHVLRLFPEPEVVHVEQTIDPIRDFELVWTEIALSDLEMAKRRLAVLEKTAKNSDTVAQNEMAAIVTLIDALKRGDATSLAHFPSHHRQSLAGIGFLTLKPMVVVFNIGEEQKGENDFVQRTLVDRFPLVKTSWIPARIESELWDLDDSDRFAYRHELDLPESAMTQLVQICYQLLNLITFFTIKSDIVRAWSIPSGTNAQKAAGKIHTDMERGFIRAEIVSVSHFLEAGGWTQARERGWLLVEGRDYVMRDGDMMLVKYQT